MAKKKAIGAIRKRPVTKTKRSPHGTAFAAIAVGVLVFYWIPLTSSQASIQWDAVDVHYTLQKYFSDQLRQGVLPFWTPYVFSGYPFLADPQVGAWYPLNWPFFLTGITPRSIQWQLALHCLVAALGTYCFVWRWLKQREAALLAAAAYALSGFFAGHSSHVGMFQTAAWFPWLLLAVREALRVGNLGWMVGGGVVIGLMALAGHFQTLVYAGFGAAAFTVWVVVRERPFAGRLAALICIFLLLGFGISCVQLLPGVELLAHSVRARADFSAATNSPLVPSALATLIYPNALGALEGDYRGPEDITQYYFYGGLLLLPLVVYGLAKSQVRTPGLVLIMPALWYAFGPAGGLYLALARLPGLGSVRAPVHIWFVVAFGLALLAAGGYAAVAERVNLGYLLYCLPLVVFMDLAYWNSFANPLAYARASFTELYGNKLAAFQQRIKGRLPETARFHAPYPTGAFGPQNHPLDARVEATYGYNPLSLQSYMDYFHAAEENPNLLDSLGARFRLELNQQSVTDYPGVLPRAYFPKSVIMAKDSNASLAELSRLDPAEQALSPREVAEQDPEATATIVEHRGGYYRVRYRCRTPSLLRVAEAYYPGWEASVGGTTLDVLRVDHALLGVIVPAGEGELILRFRPSGFGIALSITVAALLLSGYLMFRHRGSQDFWESRSDRRKTS